MAKVPSTFSNRLSSETVFGPGFALVICFLFRMTFISLRKRASFFLL